MEKLLFLLLPVPFAVGLLSPGAAVEPVPGTPVVAFQDPAIDESSGLVAGDGVVVTVNDSGDSNRIFTVDLTTGKTVGVTQWQGEARDIEALAPAGPDEVWVGDIGDNTATRDHVTVSRVPYGRGERTVTAPTYELVYPDGAHDAETLLSDPATGRLYVVVKEFIGRLYAAPAKLDPDGPNRLEPVKEVLGIATDGAFFPDGEHVVLRNYGQAVVYTWPELERVGRFDLPAQKQGEGIAVAADGQVLLSSEGVGAEVLRVDLPFEAAAPGEPGEPAGTDGPATDRDPEAQAVWWPWAALGGGLVVALGTFVALARRRG
ncbi:hypothetical protein [Pimelobacter sp. 30-1]|uniref:hypothetical protein n=1 Tax=Pimelobacter sp. 30-1 TaxID=2004991 RepID=UPI001C03CED5|nr:hypothetical protein [Pimelobacter sp. 30-1]MBU2694906.1 hypothetical protein [Pimelobacter sp. 30-1]